MPKYFFIFFFVNENSSRHTFSRFSGLYQTLQLNGFAYCGTKKIAAFTKLVSGDI